MKNEPRVAAIIPAYNEETTIGDVVKVLWSSPLVYQVIVVSDGSADKTAEVARAAGAEVYDLRHNVGKGSAMLHGVTHTDAPIILFADADLRGFTKKHVEQLLRPVLSGARTMNVGTRDRGKLFFSVAKYLPLISGERAMKRKVFEAVPPQFLKGFMVESSLNYYCRSHKLPYGSVPLVGLQVRRKYEKVGWLLGGVQYLKMLVQMLKAMVLVRWAKARGKF